MGRPRKRHEQQLLPLDGKQPRKKRRGAAKGGRPPKGERSSERHEVREEVRKNEPVHVVLRSAPDVGTLRRGDIYRCIRGAMVSTLVREDFHVVHVSIQGTHIHLLVEAEDKMALARGMQALQISAARRINSALRDADGNRRHGSVFPDRYHARIIRKPRQARNALAYVLNNWRKHGAHSHKKLGKYPVDVFSSATSFTGWLDLDVATLELPPTYEPLPVWQPQTWLLTTGWRRHGLIGSREVPGGPQRGACVLAE